jgi:hypothetical protein
MEAADSDTLQKAVIIAKQGSESTTYLGSVSNSSGLEKALHRTICSIACKWRTAMHQDELQSPSPPTLYIEG